MKYTNSFVESVHTRSQIQIWFLHAASHQHWDAQSQSCRQFLHIECPFHYQVHLWPQWNAKWSVIALSTNDWHTAPTTRISTQTVTSLTPRTLQDEQIVCLRSDLPKTNTTLGFVSTEVPPSFTVVWTYRGGSTLQNTSKWRPTWAISFDW